MSGIPGRGSGARARRRRGTSGLGCLPPHNPHLELGVATRRSPAGVVFFAQLNVFMQNGCVLKCYINCIKLDKVTCNSGATVGRPTHNTRSRDQIPRWPSILPLIGCSAKLVDNIVNPKIKVLLPGNKVQRPTWGGWYGQGGMGKCAST